VARKKPGGNPSIGIGFHFETTKGTSSRVERKEKNFVKKPNDVENPFFVRSYLEEGGAL
jgi:hypothetical protein